jgi:RNA polymerase sigma-70 factor (ECF subfamily)
LNAASTNLKPEGHPSQTPADQHELDRLDRVCAGEKQLFYALIQPYERQVYRTAFAILRNQQDTEDVVQEAMLKALTHLKSFRREAKFSTWLIQITLNEARMRLRKERRNLYESIDEGVDNEEGDYIPRDFADWREIPSEALEQKRLKEALQGAIASLAPKYQDVFILRDVEKVNIADTARILGISIASVKTRLLRARLLMRDALAPGFDGNWTSDEGKWKKVRPW